MNKQPSVLIVEDEQIVALDLRNRVQDLGYAVLAVTASGEQAIDYVVQNQPDLILMDIRLQGSLDGIETVQRIQQQFDIPVVYLTASSDEETMKRAETTRPVGCLFKPFEDDRLEEILRTSFFTASSATANQ